jgi:hypothetical protein
MTVESRKLQETARQLGLSPKTLEQYFALKAAEVGASEQAAPRRLSPTLKRSRRVAKT